jgi:triacylglycerol esterase/lipase EstA (alpha/beta hydrolase family)
MKKIIAFTLTLVILAGIFILPASATDTTDRILNTESFSTDYPFIFVHGMGGWGTSDPYYSESPYWGGNLLPGSENDMIRILNEQGVKAYAPSVGPLSSAWDRACELYAQLTGTVVDYGEAHSKKHGHDRFGLSYEGNSTMGEPWNLSDKINLVGHSFGGATVRLFTSLMAFGSQDEIEATGKNTSPFFKGGHDSVHACVTLSAPHNGSQVSNYLVDTKLPLLAIATGAHILGCTKGDSFGVFSLKFGHFGLTPKQGQAKAKFNPFAIWNFYKANDNCGYDMTLAGASELNKTIKLSPDTYYYSYSTAATEPTGPFGRQQPIDSVNSIFKTSSTMIAITEGMTIDGIKIEGNWAVNDGIVPLASALYPDSDEATATDYEDSLAKKEKIKPGRWYYTDTMVGMDHFDFCGTEDYPVSFRDFYFSMVETVNSR